MLNYFFSHLFYTNNRRKEWRRNCSWKAKENRAIIDYSEKVFSFCIDVAWKREKSVQVQQLYRWQPCLWDCSRERERVVVSFKCFLAGAETRRDRFKCDVKRRRREHSRCRWKEFRGRCRCHCRCRGQRHWCWRRAGAAKDWRRKSNLIENGSEN